MKRNGSPVPYASRMTALCLENAMGAPKIIGLDIPTFARLNVVCDDVNPDHASIDVRKVSYLEKKILRYKPNFKVYINSHRIHLWPIEKAAIEYADPTSDALSQIIRKFPPSEQKIIHMIYWDLWNFKMSCEHYKTIWEFLDEPIVSNCHSGGYMI